MEHHLARRLGLADFEGDLPLLEVPFQGRVVEPVDVDAASIRLPNLVDLAPDAHLEPEREPEEARTQQHRASRDGVVGRKDARDERRVGKGVPTDEVTGDGERGPRVVGRERRAGRLGDQLRLVVVETPPVGLGVVVVLVEVEVVAGLPDGVEPLGVIRPVGAARDGAGDEVSHRRGRLPAR